MSKKIRVAIVGVGNCASSLIQGVHFYQTARPDDLVPGLMHVDLGGYHPRDIEFSAAFDVNAHKVGRDLGEAIFAAPNNTVRFAEVPALDVPVHRGPTYDGLGKYLKDVVPEAPGARLMSPRFSGARAPTSSSIICRWFRDCRPVVRGAGSGGRVRAHQLHPRLHRLPRHVAEAFRAARVAAHRRRHQIAGRRHDCAPHPDRSFPQTRGAAGSHLPAQLRRQYRLHEHAGAGSSGIEKDLQDAGRHQPARPSMLAENVHVGPSDYVPWLGDRKWCYIRMEGTTFGNVPLNCEVKLEVWDSPNSAGVVIDAIRCAKLALDRGTGGALDGPSSYFMKSPPVQHTDDEARVLTEQFIEEVPAAAPVPPPKAPARVKGRKAALA